MCLPHRNRPVAPFQVEDQYSSVPGSQGSRKNSFFAQSFGGCSMSSGDTRIRSFSLPTFLTMLLLGVTFAAAQNFRGGINGTVTDQAGGALPGATVQITADSTGVITSS